jgi:uncharacterized protein YegL
MALKPGKTVTTVLAVALVAGVIGFEGLMDTFNGSSNTIEPRFDEIDTSAFAPNWSAIAQWPGREVDGSAAPDPNRLTTVIVLDDSGSMGADLEDAKQAVLTAVNQLPTDGIVAVLALNKGLVLKPTEVSAARRTLPAALAPLIPDGNTPLGSSLFLAYELLGDEAALQRGFGSYRALITTDGQASDGDLLQVAITEILSQSPVEIATIGIGIGEGHPLNMPGFTEYVSVSSVEGLADALIKATAEQTSFEPITNFQTVAD